MAQIEGSSDPKGGAGRRDERRRSYVVPTRIVWSTPAPLVEYTPLLLAEGPMQPSLAAPAVALIRSTREERGSLLLDFGRELYGGIQLAVGDTPGHRPVRIRLRFGESASEAWGGPDGRESSVSNDHSIHDTVVDAPWLGTLEAGSTGFRFLRVEIAEPDCFVALLGVRAVALIRDLPWVGSFESSDPLVDRIWCVGATTVHLCMQEFLWDGIKRDRLVWAGDIHPETRVISEVFGRADVVERSLELLRDETPTGWMNGISSYTLWWIVTLRDWYRRHDCRDFLEAQADYLRKLLPQLQGCIGPDGRERLPVSRFIDWPSSADPTAVDAGLQALLVIAVEALGELYAVLGDSSLAARCRAGLAGLRGCPYALHPSKQAASLATLAGLVDPREANERVLSRDPLRGVSSFFGYYVLEARALAGDHGGCLELIRRYWGAMLEQGATTFWEDFDLDWTREAGRIDELPTPGTKDLHADFGAYCYKGLRHSLCHGWAAGPTAWLSRHVLGVVPLEIGYRRIRLAPELGDLRYAAGSVPTPLGPVHVEHRRLADGSIDTRHQAPLGLSVERA